MSILFCVCVAVKAMSADEIEARKRSIQKSLILKLLAQEDPIITHNMKQLLLGDGIPEFLMGFIARVDDTADSNQTTNDEKNGSALATTASAEVVAQQRSLSVVRIFTEASTTIRDMIHLKTPQLLNGWELLIHNFEMVFFFFFFAIFANSIIIFKKQTFEFNPLYLY